MSFSGPEGAKEFVLWFWAEGRVLVGHNFLAYDAPVLNRLWAVGIAVGKIIDTFIMSQMYAPNIGGGHSLAAWGIRLKHLKGDHSEFHIFTPAMLKYCGNDATLTAMVFKALVGRMKKEGFSERGIALEHNAWHIIQNKQKQHGFPFDQEKADTLYAELRAREAELKEEIYRLWPPVFEHVRTFARALKSDGTPTAVYQRHLGEYPTLEINDDGSYNAFDYVSFDLGSPKQRIQKLLDLGWEPINFTEKGSPKIDEDEMLAFAALSGVTEAKALAGWCVVNARANMIRTWMNAVNPYTGNIHGSLFLAATGRYKHSKPNTANIPATRHGPDDEPLMGEAGTWACECRSLWTAGGKDWVLVGMDGKGMQSRCLAHNVAKLVGMERGQEFIDDLLVGDIHKKNIERFGFPTKPAAKKAYYTIFMGGGGAKIALDQAQFGWHIKASDGNRIKNGIVAGIAGFKELINHLQSELRDTGRITLCDGTKLSVPSDHMVIPYLLQGDESRLMKQTMIYIDAEIRKRKLEKKILKVGDIHDEFQYRCRKGYENEFVEFALPCFLRAGESFGYLIPNEGDAKIGNNWSETH